MKTPLIILTLVSFLINSVIGPLPLARADDFLLPAPGVMVRLSPPLDPPILKGIKVHPDDPFRFDFILDKGNSDLNNDQIKNESAKLIKYFLASLTIPEKDLWVNLSPYEKDRIIPQSFGLTEMGRDLLAEDYILKQITASLIYPEDQTGKIFWKRIYEEARKKFGTTNIPVNTFNKVWIVPQQAVVYENAQAGTAYVVESKLKVMLEEDYLSLEKHEGLRSKQVMTTDASRLGSQIVREIVIPELTREVNENKNFIQLRQVYNSLILATWYKMKIKASILSQVYEDKNKVKGVAIDDPKEKERIYQRYLKAFQKGVYNYIKDELDTATQESVPRKYFSGGVNFDLAMDSTNMSNTQGILKFVGNYSGNAIEADNDHALLIETNIDPASQGNIPVVDPERAFYTGDLDEEQKVEVLADRLLTKTSIEEHQRIAGILGIHAQASKAYFIPKVRKLMETKKEVLARIGSLDQDNERLRQRKKAIELEFAGDPATGNIGLSKQTREMEGKLEQVRFWQKLKADRFKKQLAALEARRHSLWDELERIKIKTDENDKLSGQLRYTDLAVANTSIQTVLDLGGELPSGIFSSFGMEIYPFLRSALSVHWYGDREEGILLQGRAAKAAEVIRSLGLPAVQELQAEWLKYHTNSYVDGDLTRAMIQIGEPAVPGLLEILRTHTDLTYKVLQILTHMGPQANSAVDEIIAHRQKIMQMPEKPYTGNVFVEFFDAVGTVSTVASLPQIIERIQASSYDYYVADFELAAVASVADLPFEYANIIMQRLTNAPASYGAFRELKILSRTKRNSEIVPWVVGKLKTLNGWRDDDAKKLYWDYLEGLGADAIPFYLEYLLGLNPGASQQKDLLIKFAAQWLKDGIPEAVRPILEEYFGGRVIPIQEGYQKDFLKALLKGPSAEKVLLKVAGQTDITDRDIKFFNDLDKDMVPLFIQTLKGDRVSSEESRNLINLMFALKCGIVPQMKEAIAPVLGSIEGYQEDRNYGDMGRIRNYGHTLGRLGKEFPETAVSQIVEAYRTSKNTKAQEILLKALSLIATQEAITFLSTIAKGDFEQSLRLKAIEGLKDNVNLFDSVIPDLQEITAVLMQAEGKEIPVGLNVAPTSSSAIPQAALEAIAGCNNKAVVIPALLAIVQNNQIPVVIRNPAIAFLDKYFDDPRVYPVLSSVFTQETNDKSFRLAAAKVITKHVLPSTEATTIREKLLSRVEEGLAKIRTNAEATDRDLFDEMETLNSLCKQNPDQLVPVLNGLIKILKDDQKATKIVISQRPYSTIKAGFAKIVGIDPRQSGPLLYKTWQSDPELFNRPWQGSFTITTIFTISFQALPDFIIARLFGVNIKVARYLKEKGGFDRLFDANFKELINAIAYNLNRERTSHPSERRLGEDEKTSLFSYLFEQEDLTGASRIFNTYFRNDPENYILDVSSLVKLLQHVPIEQVRSIIRTVIEDPKQSLDEVIAGLKTRLQGQENADFIIRDISWILSNLFVLQDRMDQLQPIVDAFHKAGKTTADLIVLLENIDQARSLSGLNAIAKESGLGIMDIFNFKMESIPQEKREELMADSLNNKQELGQEDIQEILNLFDFQPAESKRRIFFKLLFMQSTDNVLIRKVMNEIRSNTGISMKNMPDGLKRFFRDNRPILIEDRLFEEFWNKTEEIAEAAQRKEIFKQLRALYIDRKPGRAKLSAEMVDRINGLEREITLKKGGDQIPHIDFEPLLKMNVGHEALNTLRTVFKEMDNNRSMRDQLATLKNRLYEHINAFSTIESNDKGKFFANILAFVVNKRGPPSQDNIQDLYNDLLYYLEQIGKTIDTSFKASKNLFPPTINDELLNSSRTILDALLNERTINDELIKALGDKLSTIEVDALMARLNYRMSATDKIEVLKRAGIPDEETALAMIKKYASNNPRANWRDHEGRSIFELMDKYLANINDVEVYINLYEALLMEVQGRFHQWRYQSKDYLETLDAVVDIEAAKLSPEDKPVFDKLLANTEGQTKYEKLRKMEGFLAIKERLERIRNWEITLSKDVGDDLKAEFTDDFYHLFNIGNYSGSTACQSNTYGYDLNRGLTGYTVNGTNRAVAVINGQNQVVPARRIVRLRILEDSNGHREPVIFVEESTQFGVNHIDELYSLLDELSRRTGLPVVASYHRPAQTDKVTGGENKIFKIDLYAPRSNFDYSDEYGSLVQGKISAGLYRHPEGLARMQTPNINLLIKPAVSSDQDLTIVASNLPDQGQEAQGPKDKALFSSLEKGGIDLTPANMHLHIQNAGAGINFHLDPGMLQELQNAPGFVPVIINVKPLKDLRQFLGIQPNTSASAAPV